LLIATFFSWRAIEGIADVLGVRNSSATMHWVGAALWAAIAVTVWHSIEVAKEWRTSRTWRRRGSRLIKF
jgi:glycerol kinase